MNLNKLAELVCKHEGKKEQVNIAQVKEIITVLSKILIKKPLYIIALLKRGLK